MRVCGVLAALENLCIILGVGWNGTEVATLHFNGAANSDGQETTFYFANFRNVYVSH